MTPARSTLRRVAAAAALVAGAAAAPLAHAENHALIMWIGDYGNPQSNLPGIDLDAANAKKIAAAMGVPAQNVVEVSNRSLTRQAVANALANITRKIQDGDKVFLYYSGHGTQAGGVVAGARCTEAMVVAGEQQPYFLDAELQTALTQLGSKASQVVMMNDSCFSGGAATKDLERGAGDAKPKFLSGVMKPNTAITAGYQCGEAVNKMARNLEVVGAQPRGPQVLYIAASSDTEVSYATSKGSVATLAWVDCLASRPADPNGSGSINGEELRQCAQKFITQAGYRQTVMLQGNTKLPLAFGTGASGPGGGGGGTAAVNAAQALQDLRAGADKSYQIQLRPARSTMQIRQDFLDFSLTTNREGYLYVLQVGSDGKTFNMLFPNKIDSNNFVSSGTHNFPRESWRVRAGGPAGTSHLLAIISPVKKDIGKDMDLSSVFPHADATQANLKTLYAEASGASGGSGRYGASDVVQIHETN